MNKERINKLIHSRLVWLIFTPQFISYVIIAGTVGMDDDMLLFWIPLIISINKLGWIYLFCLIPFLGRIKTLEKKYPFLIMSIFNIITTVRIVLMFTSIGGI